MSSFLLTELETENRIRQYLDLKEFYLETRDKLHGIDIIAYDNTGVIHYFEIEGNKKPNGKSFTSSQKYTHFLRGFGQICMRMEREGKFALGIPYDTLYEKYVFKTTKARYKLDLKIFVVYPDEIKII